MTGEVKGALTEGLSARVARVLWEGLCAGLFAAVLVAVTYLAFDFLRGAPLHTPMVLGTLSLEGAKDAQSALTSSHLVFRFTILHVMLWVAAGILCSCLINIGEIYPRLWHLVFSLIVFLLGSSLYLSGALSMPGLPSLHLWLGTVLGSAALMLFLARRHPSAIRQLGGITVTETALHDLETALAQEQRSLALYSAAAADMPANVTIGLWAERAGKRVHSLLVLFERLDLPRADTPPEGQSPSPASAVEALRAAIRLEEQKVTQYDRFLISVDEQAVHSLFLALAAESQDHLIPEIRSYLTAG